MSILDRKPDVRAKRSAPATEPKTENAELKGALATVEALTAELERRATDLGAVRADLAAARAETVAERERTDALRTQLREEGEACAEAQIALASERAVSAGLREQLVAANVATASLKAPLEQAIAAAAKPPQIIVPASEPPAYELQVTGRDVNERAKTIVLKPIKAGG